jgi:hypothetical protein
VRPHTQIHWFQSADRFIFSGLCRKNAALAAGIEGLFRAALRIIL